MRRWTCTEFLVVVLLVFFKAASVSAVSPDPRLLSLVPPAARVIAGMKAPSIDGQPKSFMLVTPNNSIDLVDFIALTGGDPTRFSRTMGWNVCGATFQLGSKSGRDGPCTWK
jgi:hypothetical protein